MARRYLVVSDLHLCDVEDHPDGWKRYKRQSYVFDDEFAALLDDFLAAGGDEFTLVLNGDIFDFDLVSAVPDDPPFPVSRAERRRGLDATAAKSRWKLERVLAHHPRFVAALAEFLARGHEVVYVLGNHDREVHFPAVRAALEAALQRAGAAPAAAPPGFRPRFRIEEWFYYVPGELYAEHGHQYDYYSSFRHLLAPTVEVGGEQVVAVPMGNLSNRYLLSRMGFFNPHTGEYILNIFRYLAHWVRHYAWSRRGLVVPWLWGSLVVMATLLNLKRKLLPTPATQVAGLAETARRYALPAETTAALWGLQRPPITERFFRIIREFWIDRLLIAVLMTGGTIALALVPIPLWIKLMVPLSSFPLLYFIYEWLARGETIFSIEKKLPGYARQIAALLPTQVVTFGHTHVPRLIPLDDAVAFVDTGTWAPITRPRDDTRLAPGYHKYLVVEPGGARPCLKFGCWHRTA
ncbi:MAG: metallophosphoesterase [Deltaproteobacteria bacterium]|nr:metallophosphoesterase [Deltaproteobacteria bacterium]